MTSLSSWLEHKLIEHSNGVIFDHHNSNSFDLIQDFIENFDLSFQTPIIYYQAFPEESAIEFLNTLRNELSAKLAKSPPVFHSSLLEIIEAARLKMIVIDRCHLHPQDTLDCILEFFSSCNVAVILVGDHEKMAISQILKNLRVCSWERFEITKPLQKWMIENEQWTMNNCPLKKSISRFANPT